MAILLEEKTPAEIPNSPVRRGFTTPRSWEAVLAACGLLVAVLIVFDVRSDALPVFKLDALAIFKFAVCLVLPGWAILLRLPRVDLAARLVWTAVASAVIYAAIALAMGWLQLWNPRPTAAVVLVAAALYLVVGPRPRLVWSHVRLRRPHLRESVPWMILATALVMWAAALASSGREQLGTLGLLTVFPIMWYLALAVVVGLCIWGIAVRRVGSAAFMSTTVAGLVLMLYSSASLVSDSPRLPWTYKHIAVTDLIGTTGQIDPTIDIYNRWPGFFSLSAFLGESIGYKDALSYAAWAETGFALIGVVLVLAIARTLSRNPRIYWTAAVVFVLANWINQNYYSPQAFAYTLHLTMCLIILTFLRGNPAAWVIALERRLTLPRLRRPKPAAPETYDRRPQAAVIAAVLAIQFVLVASHQLTPYLAILALFPLFIMGYFRPQWLAPALLLIALLYLLPNVDFIRGKYGLFSGFDIFANIGYQKTGTETSQWLLTGRLIARASLALSVLTGLLAAAGFVRRILQGHVRSALIVAFFAASPIVGLFLTSYGGEGRLRVYMFALPWLAVGVAWLFWSGPIRIKPAVVGITATFTAMAVLFTGIYFASEASLRVSTADVGASRWLDSNIRSGDLIVETNDHLPLLVGPNYPHYLAAGGVTSIARNLRASTTVTVDDVKARARHIRGGDLQNVYVVISDDHAPAAGSTLKSPSHETMSDFEYQLMGEGVQKVFTNSSVRIYMIPNAG